VPCVRCFGRCAELNCAIRRTRWRRPRTPAPRSGRAFHLLPVLVREPCCSVHGEPNHAATHLGVPPWWRDSNGCKPAFEPRTFFCRCLCARELAAASPRAMATASPLAKPSAQAFRAVSCALTAFPGSRPSSHDLTVQGRARLVRPEHTPELWSEAGSPWVVAPARVRTPGGAHRASASEN
jgi:hypothetical protein